ncbi:GspH/FimT family pseudopilin [Lysobacter soli]|uniref:GspH/FimT family pseudopilin n=1 Tax=Lysobacter TaxID=68 RepID=UPI00178A1D6E|nr:GspH/FimT family pseudopilin [Lysobacter soli]UTA55686.1 GspH/FimT family pseudopilin [Lysobacter soli]
MTSSASRGFTLIELMITIAVLAIGSALAYPAFTSVIKSNRIATSTNGLLAAFNLARTEAIRSNRGGGVCPSTSGAQCDGADWNVGYLAYTDMDSSGTFTTGDTAIRYFEGNSALRLTAVANGGGVSQIPFDRTGRTSQQAELTLKLADCSTGQDYQRLITLKRSGQARMEKRSCQ